MTSSNSENLGKKVSEVALSHPNSWYSRISKERQVYQRTKNGYSIQINFNGESPIQDEDGTCIGSIFEDDRNGDKITRYSYIYEDGRVKTQELSQGDNGEQIENSYWLDEQQIAELNSVVAQLESAA